MVRQTLHFKPWCYGALAQFVVLNPPLSVPPASKELVGLGWYRQLLLLLQALASWGSVCLNRLFYNVGCAFVQLWYSRNRLCDEMLSFSQTQTTKKPPPSPLSCKKNIFDCHFCQGCLPCVLIKYGLHLATYCHCLQYH